MWSICYILDLFTFMSTLSSSSSVAIRAYALAVLFSTIPALLPTLPTSFTAKRRSSSSSPKSLLDVLRCELGPTGLPFAMAVAAGGGKEDGDKHNSWSRWQWRSRLLSYVLSSWVAIHHLHARRQALKIAPYPLAFSFGTQFDARRASPTLDFTLLLLVRALDVAVGGILNPKCRRTGVKRWQWRSQLDAFVFWVSCSRIMWCFFYEPQRLPKSYNRWIASLASIDPRIIEALRSLRTGAWRYGSPSLMHSNLVSSLSRDLGYPASWGRPELVPARGINAHRTWHELGVYNRDGLGGIPCEIVHGGIGGGSCLSNASLRGLRAFYKALLIYLPVHVLPAVILRPQTIMNNPTKIVVSLLRSASFLASFVSAIWFFVCFTRTLVLARLFPSISHNVWDGPYVGGVSMGSLLCGASIFVEAGRRRAEIALYVLPRALRASLNESWMTGRERTIPFYCMERITFALSLGYLLATAMEASDQLRGLTRWTLTFLFKGPDLGRFYRKLTDIRRKRDHERNGKDHNEGHDELSGIL